MQKGLYKHYKGNYYAVLYVGRDSETLEEVVVYQAQHGEHEVWVRPKKMFQQNVEIEHETVARFTFISANIPETNAAL